MEEFIFCISLSWSDLNLPPHILFFFVFLFIFTFILKKPLYRIVMIKSKKKLIFLFIIISICSYLILSYSIKFYFSESANFKLSEPDDLSNLSKIEFNDRWS